MLVCKHERVNMRASNMYIGRYTTTFESVYSKTIYNIGTFNINIFLL